MTETTDALAQYFKNVYPHLCIPDSRFLSSKQGLVNTSRVIVLLFLPIQLLTAYCILKKTPENMKNIKGSINNLNFWCMVSSIIFAFFACPYSFHPYKIGFTIGLLADWGVPTNIQFYIDYIINIVVTMSITILFENRSSLIARNRFRIKTTAHRFIWILLNILWFMTIILPPAFNKPDQMEAKMLVLNTCPCPTTEFFSEKLFASAKDGFWNAYLNMNGLVVFLGFTIQAVFFACCCIYYLFISTSSHVSPQTRRLQIRAFFGVVIQTMIPILLLSIPIMIFMSSRKNEGSYDQVQNNLMIITVSIQDGATSLSILLVHHPYRSFVKSIFCCKKTNKSLQTVHVVTDSFINT
ncbi:hypothetical protein GCK72_007204 [Caenorhabditis remanei]|uniref:Serpentine Receptor, class H n=1 Tax=Caenorhabditis remanei TaxID=31234 RepID=A0A6A5HIG7_CAERE|nr:hypothetical protein GCK72_007204 [Caenorhabditis remanei]KAF1767245.1 hypothetical protein GCK72_007204 [Caenorhabditis remanei]